MKKSGKMGSGINAGAMAKLGKMMAMGMKMKDMSQKMMMTAREMNAMMKGKKRMM